MSKEVAWANLSQ